MQSVKFHQGEQNEMHFWLDLHVSHGAETCNADSENPLYGRKLWINTDYGDSISQ